MTAANDSHMLLNLAFPVSTLLEHVNEVTVRAPDTTADVSMPLKLVPVSAGTSDGFHIGGVCKLFYDIQ